MNNMQTAAKCTKQHDAVLSWNWKDQETFVHDLYFRAEN